MTPYPVLVNVPNEARAPCGADPRPAEEPRSDRVPHRWLRFSSYTVQHYPAQLLTDGWGAPQAGLERNLVACVAPVYPQSAIDNWIHGEVRLLAIIDKTGRVRSIAKLSGHPALRRAASKAVKQWIRRPIKLGGKPVEALTTITVNFSLDVWGPAVSPCGQSTREGGNRT